MTKKGDSQIDLTTILNTKFQLSMANGFWVMRDTNVRTYRRHDETSQNGFRDGQNGYFRWNLKTENFREYNTSFTSYKADWWEEVRSHPSPFGCAWLSIYGLVLLIKYTVSLLILVRFLWFFYYFLDNLVTFHTILHIIYIRMHTF